MGIPAKAAVMAVADDSDLEVRSRAREILKTVDRLELEARVRAFVRSAASGEADLPGWDGFSELVGNSRSARRLFAEMYSAEHELLDAIAVAPETTAEKLEARAVALQQTMAPNGFVAFGRGQTRPEIRPVPLGSAATLLFASLYDQGAPPAQSIAIIGQISLKIPREQLLHRRELLPHWRRLVGAWAARDFGDEMVTLYHQSAMASGYDAREGAAPARKLVESPTVPPQIALFGILALAKLGSSDDLPALERWLADATVLIEKNGDAVKVSLETRDVALYAAVRLSGQSPKEYGYASDANESIKSISPQETTVAAMRFASEEARTAAFAKWSAWRASQE